MVRHAAVRNALAGTPCLPVLVCFCQTLNQPCMPISRKAMQKGKCSETGRRNKNGGRWGWGWGRQGGRQPRQASKRQGGRPTVSNQLCPTQSPSQCYVHCHPSKTPMSVCPTSCPVFLSVPVVPERYGQVPSMEWRREWEGNSKWLRGLFAQRTTVSAANPASCMRIAASRARARVYTGEECRRQNA